MHRFLIFALFRTLVRFTFDKRDDFNFEIVNLPFLGVDVPRSPSMVYIFLSLFVLQKDVLML